MIFFKFVVVSQTKKGLKLNCSGLNMSSFQSCALFYVRYHHISNCPGGSIGNVEEEKKMKRKKDGATMTDVMNITLHSGEVVAEPNRHELWCRTLSALLKCPYFLTL